MSQNKSSPSQNSPESQTEPQIPFTEMLKSVPEFFGIRMNEEPAYEVLETSDDVEVRRYEPQTLAAITLKAQDFDAFREAAFKRLANYIFKGNDKKESIEMTSPVIQHEKGEVLLLTNAVAGGPMPEAGWTMSFILPKNFTLANAPKPLDSEIKLYEKTTETVAALRYGGNNDLEKAHDYQEQLQAWLASNEKWQSNGEVYFAQYDAPFVIPIFKRNEVLVPVVGKDLH